MQGLEGNFFLSINIIVSYTSCYDGFIILILYWIWSIIRSFITHYSLFLKLFIQNSLSPFIDFYIPWAFEKI
jgi:hypothetical protein